MIPKRSLELRKKAGLINTGGLKISLFQNIEGKEDDFLLKNYNFGLHLILKIMAIPSRPINQDPQSRILWEISKQLDRLIKIMGSSNTTTTTTTAIP